jgi:hypothetical protein
MYKCYYSFPNEDEATILDNATNQLVELLEAYELAKMTLFRREMLFVEFLGISPLIP